MQHGETTHLVMRLVLPTDWSPRRTIFVRLGGAEARSVCSAMAVVVEGE